MSTQYRVDSLPPGGQWDEGGTWPTERAATCEMDRLAAAMPTWHFRVMRVRSDVRAVHWATREERTI